MNHGQALDWRGAVVLSLLLCGCVSVNELRPGVYRLRTAGNNMYFPMPDLQRRLDWPSHGLRVLVDRASGQVQYVVIEQPSPV